MKVTITAECRAMIALRANNPLENTPRLPDGSYVIDLTDDTYELILEKQFKGETISDTIFRLCLVHGKLPQ